MTRYVILENTSEGYDIIAQVNADNRKKALQKILDQQPEPFDILTIPQHDKLDTDYLVIAEQNIGNYNVSFSEDYK